MRLLNVHTLQLEDFTGRKVPPYCILSHRWGDEEVSFKELRKGLKHTGDGYRKIVDFCRVVKQRPVHYDTVSRQFVKGKRDWVWIDTCCIDKRSSAELSEAINSMYEWYRNASECFVYLSDIDIIPRSDNVMTARQRGAYHSRIEVDPRSYSVEKLAASVWFTRGWTLQELLAPPVLVFCNADWMAFGHVFREVTGSRIIRNDIEELYGRSIANDLTEIRGIPEHYLLKQKPLTHASVAQRMGWASHRETNRLEDQAYCLLGIFGINMPLLYGEGRNAFLRLQQEIIKRSTDESILAWGRFEEKGETATGSSLGILADSPHRFSRVDSRWESCRTFYRPYAITNNGLEIRTNLLEGLVTGAHGEKRRRVLLMLNYSRDKNIHSVSIPLRIVEPNIYERAGPILCETSFKNRGSPHWVATREKLIYLRTGLELHVVKTEDADLDLIDVSG